LIEGVDGTDEQLAALRLDEKATALTVTMSWGSVSTNLMASIATSCSSSLRKCGPSDRAEIKGLVFGTDASESAESSRVAT